MSEQAHHYTARVCHGESVGVTLPGCEYVLTVKQARQLADSIEDALDHLDGTIAALKEAIKDPPVRTLTAAEPPQRVDDSNRCGCGHSRGRHITAVHGKPLGKCYESGCNCRMFREET